MTILEQIVAYKRAEVSLRMANKAESVLEDSPLYVRACFSLKEHLRKPEASQIIAEFKRQSPSKGIINATASLTETIRGYAKVASGVSILTDKKFFGGSRQDIEFARPEISIPILRKDFILTTYQITEAKALGADVVLLIAAILSESLLAELANFAQSLGMEVICEVHDEEELKKAILPTVDIIGINNRDLRDFGVNLDIAKKLSEKIPTQYLKIAESGINSPDDVVELKKHGYEGFLIGERFMKEEKPDEALRIFAEELRKKLPVMPTENLEEPPIRAAE